MQNHWANKSYFAFLLKKNTSNVRSRLLLTKHSSEQFFCLGVRSSRLPIIFHKQQVPLIKTSFLEYLDQYKNVASVKYGTIEYCADCTDTDLVTYTHVQIIKRARHIPRMFDKTVTKRILEGSLRRRKPVGKPKNIWKDEVHKCATTLPNTKNLCSGKTQELLEETTGEAMARKGSN